MTATDESRKRFLDLDYDKLRGGYYTSSEVADWLTAWAVRSKTDRVLEPSCGDGAFVESAAKRLLKLNATGKDILTQVVGVELCKAESRKSIHRLKELLGTSAAKAIKTGDFFEHYRRLRKTKFDCVVGNPPFIRYQTFPEPSRTMAMELMEEAGLKPNRLTNIWVPFVTAAMGCLKDGGRLAMVLPAELLQVTYASQLRSYLVDKFAKVDIVTCNEMFFEKAEQEVVLLLADGKRNEGSSCRVTLTESPTVREIVARTVKSVVGKAEPKMVCHDSEKWLKYFLSTKEIEFMREVRNLETVVPLRHHASVEVGVVTGKNAFFVVTAEEVEEHGLEEYILPLIGRSAHLRGAKLTKGEWNKLSQNGEKVQLFSPGCEVNGSLSKKAKKYVKIGEQNGVNKGYKCSLRDPWYTVPSLWVPGCFMFRQIYDFPRVVLNRAQATSTDTIHRMRCKTDPVQVATGIYNHLTGASAEIEGRSYGGGVLELEPNEAKAMLVPRHSPNALGINECDAFIREGNLTQLLIENDKRILQDGVGLSKKDCQLARQIWEKMKGRRMSRRKSKKKKLN